MPNDNNGEKDIFLYDRQGGTTTLVSRNPSGHSANGRSSQPEISFDGKTITFRSKASNLVPGDVNGIADIFVYDVETGRISLVSKADNGALANGTSLEPSICGDGRFVSYTTDATNLFKNDVNNRRDVVLHDRIKGTNSVATINWQGVLGNGKAHRSFLTPDCRSITYASDASNLVPNDDNAGRDIFVGEIYLPADFAFSYVRAPGAAEPAEIITYTAKLSNIGYLSSTASFASPIPTHTTYVTGSVSAGATYNPGENRIEWQGELEGLSEKVITFAVVVEASLVDPTIIASESTLSGDGYMRILKSTTIVHADQTYLSLVRR